MSPTQRSLAHLRSKGYVAHVVERFNPYAKVRVDLFGFIDIVAITHKMPVLAIQACTTGDMSKRIEKIKSSPLSACWLSTGARLEVWGWAKRGKAGKRKLWTLKVEEIGL